METAVHRTNIFTCQLLLFSQIGKKLQRRETWFNWLWCLTCDAGDVLPAVKDWTESTYRNVFLWIFNSLHTSLFFNLQSKRQRNMSVACRCNLSGRAWKCVPTMSTDAKWNVVWSESSAVRGLFLLPCFEQVEPFFQTHVEVWMKLCSVTTLRVFCRLSWILDLKLLLPQRLISFDLMEDRHSFLSETWLHFQNPFNIFYNSTVIFFQKYCYLVMTFITLLVIYYSYAIWPDHSSHWLLFTMLVLFREWIHKF